jgi:hypothetical protein
MFGRRSGFRRIILVTLTTVAAVCGGAAVASAATITVSGPGDSNVSGSCPSSPCLLRQAITYADANPGTTISVPAGTYTFTTAGGASPSITASTTITGAGAATTFITDHSGDNNSLLTIDAGPTVAISGITFENATAAALNVALYAPGGEGGAIFNSGTLSLTSDAFSGDSGLGNTASGSGSDYGAQGGAIFNDGTLTATSCSFTSDDADGGNATAVGSGSGGLGGAIYNDSTGVATIVGATFDHNEAQPGSPVAPAEAVAYGEGEGGEGGAIYNNGGTLVVTNSSFGATTPNQALASVAATDGTGGTPPTYGGDGGEGGALYNDEGAVTLNGDSFTGNLADGAASGNQNGGDDSLGGAVFAEYGELTIHGGSFTANEATGGTAPAGAETGAGGAGGAIYLEDATLTVDAGTSFDNDQAIGGAAGSNSSGTVYGGYGGQGGAIDVEAGALSLSSVTFLSDAALAGTGAPGVSAYNYYTNGVGGAIADYGLLQATGATFTSNTATASNATSTSEGAQGGAVYLGEGYTASVASSTFSSNSASPGDSTQTNGGAGGALVSQNGVSLTLTSDTFTNNSAPNGEGGALNLSGPSTISGSALNGNSAEDGGALYADANPIAITNSTFDANTAEQTSPLGDGEGGAIFQEGYTVALANDTILANQAYGDDDGGNIFTSEGNLTAHDTIIAAGSLLGAGTGGENCEAETGSVVTDDLGYNFEDRNQCGFGATGDLINQSDADFGALASNGGPTQTVALLSGSAAINAGDPAGCTDALGAALTTDQRGTARPQGSRCDIGAYELVVPPSPPAPSPPAPSPPAPTPLLAGPIAPVLSGLEVSPAVLVSIAGGGTTIDYTDSEAATTTITVTAKLSGYKLKHGTCKSLPHGAKAPKHSSPCTHTVTEDSFTHLDSAGTNSVYFSARPNGHALPKGSYTLIATPTIAGLTGAIETATFKVAA